MSISTVAEDRRGMVSGLVDQCLSVQFPGCSGGVLYTGGWTKGDDQRSNEEIHSGSPKKNSPKKQK